MSTKYVQEILKEWFFYDETSPTFLRWKKDKFTGKNFNIHKIIAHPSAGAQRYRNGNKFRYTVMLNGKQLSIHRIIWVLHFGEIGEETEIDHIDGNPFNNIISNLRIVNRELNCRNFKKSSQNTSGFTGVQLHLDKYWKVTWREEGRARVKYFKIMVDPNETLAVAVKFRQETIARLNSYGYGYTNRPEVS